MREGDNSSVASQGRKPSQRQHSDRYRLGWPPDGPTKPDDLETARRILGHKSLKTTLRSYADIKTAAAFRKYDDLIARLRAEARVSSGPGARFHARRAA